MKKKDQANIKSPFPFQRAGGILLHPTSLPGQHGIGELGSEASKFVDFLKEHEQKIWQILPLGPTSYGNSPYQCLSAFAGNQYIISIERINEKFGISIEYEEDFIFDTKKVIFEDVIKSKWKILSKVFKEYNVNKKFKRRILNEFQIFCRKNSFWLEDYALFITLKQKNNNQSWLNWKKSYKLRDPRFLGKFRLKNKRIIDFHKFVQFLFYDQWLELKDYANSKGIYILGDLPIYVAFDSADVWANQNYFLLKKGNPIYVSGVPPDYFSKTGQRWGNPIYNWEKLGENNYYWWIERINHSLKLSDMIRIDHFRGFEAFWQIPAEESTAIKGEWIKGPGFDFFKILEIEISPLPIIAEDLGLITPEVIELRNKMNFPGMYILQFAFGDHDWQKNEFLPHNYVENAVVYTGTHDNETSLGWWSNQSETIKKRLNDYTKEDLTENSFVSRFIRLAWESIAKIAVIPMQDLLRLDNSARMNFPGRESENWEWRFTWDQIQIKNSQELLNLTKICNRV